MINLFVLKIFTLLATAHYISKVFVLRSCLGEPRDDFKQNLTFCLNKQVSKKSFPKFYYDWLKRDLKKTVHVFIIRTLKFKECFQCFQLFVLKPWNVFIVPDFLVFSSVSIKLIIFVFYVLKAL